MFKIAIATAAALALLSSPAYAQEDTGLIASPPADDSETPVVGEPSSTTEDPADTTDPEETTDPVDPVDPVDTTDSDDPAATTGPVDSEDPSHSENPPDDVQTAIPTNDVETAIVPSPAIVPSNDPAPTGPGRKFKKVIKINKANIGNIESEGNTIILAGSTTTVKSLNDLLNNLNIQSQLDQAIEDAIGNNPVSGILNGL